MRIDLVLPNEGEGSLQIIRHSARYEEIGFSGLWFTDHVVAYKSFPTFYGSYWLECLSILSYVAAITSTIRLGLGILVVPYRDGVLTAKMLAGIDQLSAGRLDLGVGTGWAKDEFIGLGREDLFNRRGAYTNEALEVFRYCWQSRGALTFEGRFHHFSDMEFEPKPVQAPSIPIWIGSSGVPDPNGAPLKRVAKYADVWHPTGFEGQILTREELVNGKSVIDGLAERSIPMSVRLHSVGHWPTERLVDLLAAYKDIGCIQVAVDLGIHDPNELLDRAEQLYRAVERAAIL